MGNGEYEIPKGFAEKRRQSIHSVLDQLESRGLLQLFGNGVDAGCYVGTSCGVLEQRGLGVVYVERDARCIPSIEKMGVSVVNDDVVRFVDSVRALDFITFFGAPSSLSINQLVDVAKSKLSNGGGIVVTGYSNIEDQVDSALRLGGRKVRFNRVHDWDSMGYVYRQ